MQVNEHICASFATMINLWLNIHFCHAFAKSLLLIHYVVANVYASLKSVGVTLWENIMT